jgi:hypothetical protein
LAGRQVAKQGVFYESDLLHIQQCTFCEIAALIPPTFSEELLDTLPLKPI